MAGVMISSSNLHVQQFLEIGRVCICEQLDVVVYKPYSWIVR